MKIRTEETDKKQYIFDNRALTALIIPLIIEQMLAVLVGMADSIMVASVGEAAVSGVSLVDNIMVLLINVFAALGTGGAVVAGQYLGQQRKEKACQASSPCAPWSLPFSSTPVNTGFCTVFSARSRRMSWSMRTPT